MLPALVRTGVGRQTPRDRVEGAGSGDDRGGAAAGRGRDGVEDSSYPLVVTLVSVLLHSQVFSLLLVFVVVVFEKKREWRKSRLDG